MAETNGHQRLITNENRLMSDVISRFMPNSESLSFLVGYFYFSGFEQLYRHIGPELELRILVGMEAESTVTGALREVSQRLFEEKTRSSLAFGISREAQRDAWYDSIEKIPAVKAAVGAGLPDFDTLFPEGEEAVEARELCVAE